MEIMNEQLAYILERIPLKLIDGFYYYNDKIKFKYDSIWKPRGLEYSKIVVKILRNEINTKKEVNGN